MTDINSSKSSTGKLGNTKQISPAKHWVFTLNNYTTEDIEEFSSSSSTKRYIFQEETGESGTPHLQGYLEFLTKKRPFSVFKNKSIHWEKCKHVKKAIAYCCKEETRTGKIFNKNIIIIEPIKCLSRNALYPWQEKVVQLAEGPVCDRSIYWYWENIGNVGKSQLVRYLCIKHNAILISGRSGDIKYQIKTFYDKHGTGPKIVIYDIPRTAENYINYTALEEVKNGLFASNKYESAMVIINPPHFFCFANFEPYLDAVSKDRWKIVEIDGGVASTQKSWM